MKKSFLLISIIVVAVIFTACSANNNLNTSTPANDTIGESVSNNKIVPSSELISMYGKTHYTHEFKDGQVIFTEEAYDPDAVDKSTWSVAWTENESTPSIISVQLVIESNGKEIYKKSVDTVKIDDEKHYIHGWNHYVLIDEIISADCDKSSKPSAYITLVDNNDVEYKVLLNSDTKMSEDDSSNDIIITDKNSTYSYWDIDKNN